MNELVKIVLTFLMISVYSYIFAQIRSEIDVYLTKKKWGLVKSLNHYTRFWITLSLCFVAIYFHFGLEWINLFLVAYMMCLFSLLFDPLYNVKRGLSQWYVGNTGWLDLVVRCIFGRGSGKEYAVCKILVIVILLTNYFTFKQL